MSILNELEKRALSGRDRAILEAYRRGYRVDDDGTFRNPDGSVHRIRPTE